MPLPIYLKVAPVPRILLKKPAFSLAYDGEFWWIDHQCFELTSLSWWPWWCLELRCTVNGGYRCLRVFQSQLSQYDHWQLMLLFKLYRL